MKKTKLLMLCFLMAFTFFMTMTEAEAAKKNKKKKPNFITIEQVTEAEAEKLDVSLRKGREVRLRLKGSEETSQALLSELKEKIKAVNLYGVIFQHDKGRKRNEGFEYKITADNAKLYETTILFLQKLRKKVIKDLRKAGTKFGEISTYKIKKREYEKFQDGKDLFLRVIYDKSIIRYYGLDRGENAIGYSEGITEQFYNPTIKLEKMEKLGQDDESIIDQYFLKSREGNNVVLKSYEEFLSGIEDKDAFIDLFEFSGEMPFLDADYQILTKEFYELSDAVKVYLIDKSQFFGSSLTPETEWANFGMIYSPRNTGDFVSGYKSMKALLDNTAMGVCHDFSCYTKQLFEQMGMEAYYLLLTNIDHASSLVKAKNSEGKILWIPFDYGIGPAENLKVPENVKERYLKTEEMRYQHYLSGVKGAPKYKNFVYTDFK